MTRDCNNRIFSVWEQSYLRSLIFENIFQFNFCMIEYEAYDENVTFYKTRKDSKSFLSFFMSITYELSENEFLIISIETVSLNALYDEEFEFNKRSHHEQIIVSNSTESTLTFIERTVKKKSQKKVEKKFES
jgi:hypothetical protein